MLVSRFMVRGPGERFSLGWARSVRRAAMCHEMSIPVGALCRTVDGRFGFAAPVA